MRCLIYPFNGSAFHLALSSLIAVASLAGLLSLSSPTDVAAGANPEFRILLHAKFSSFEPCSGFLPIDCYDYKPMVNLPSAGPVAIFPLLYRIEEVSGFQTALRWEGWQMTFALWDCQPGQICQPIVSPPNTVIVDCNFNCITYQPTVVVVGRFFLIPAGNPSCISHWIPDRPNGIHVRDCNGGVDVISDPNSLRLGRVCIGSGGITGCDDIIPVEPTTWGKIKATY